MNEFHHDQTFFLTDQLLVKTYLKNVNYYLFNWMNEKINTTKLSKNNDYLFIKLNSLN